ncbi:MAG TPA: response regulator transcription factor [Opitutaceae bacterium]
MKRVIIIEDQTAIREMLVEILRHESRYEVVGQAGDGQVGLDLVVAARPDILILDARLPVLNGLELLRRAIRVVHHLRILVFSGHENPMLVREMLEAGAHGFVEKTAGLLELRKGLDTIAAGGTYFGPSVSALLRNVVANPSVTSTSRDFLTPREREILQLVAESYSTKEIAHRLSISVKTVDNHRTNLMRKLDLHNVASITRYAMQVGLIENQSLV